MTNKIFHHLFTPIRIGPRTLRNRTWMTAHATDFATDGTFTQTSADYYEERARGGVGAITVEATAVHPTSLPRRGVIEGYDPRVVESYRLVADAVQPHGTLVFAQLWHRGRQTDGLVSRLPTWSASALPDVTYREIPHVITLAEIDEVVEAYAVSSKYAVEGGMDGVEIHGIAHGYLLNQFISPATNHRDDEYGGSLQNRMRLLRRIVNRVREVVPEDRIVGMRINTDDGMMEGGLSTDDWVEIAREIASWGVIQYLSTSQGTYLDWMEIMGTAGARPHGFEVEGAARVKAAVGDLPVLAVGRITTPEMAEELLSSGKVDIVGMARQFMADPDWARKAQDGAAEDIRPCVGTNWCAASTQKTYLACIHNPEVGREREIRDQAPPARPKRVAVVGGGPGGLRAALTSAQRGHDVTLFERSDRLGGQLNLITTVPTCAEWSGIADWLVSQLGRTDVKILMNHEATAQELAEDYEAIVVATGSTPLRHGWTAAHPIRWKGPALPGADQANVLTPADVLGGAELPTDVLILDDTGERQPFIVAEYLALRHHHVHVVTGFPQIGHLMAASMDLGFTYGMLRKLGVTFQANTELLAIEGNTAVLADMHTREQTRYGTGAVVLVLGNRADDALARELDSLAHPGLEVRAVGDCQSPRRVFNAIYEGDHTARAL